MSCPDSVYVEFDAEYEAGLAKLNKEFEGVPNVPDPDKSDLAAIEFKKRRVELRLKWWEQQVAVTMEVMNTLKEEVSDFLLNDNKTCFLNMAYEEVGFPTTFCGKKKYFMKAHIKEINFRSKGIFIRGIDIIKQGQALISKQLGEEFMHEALSPENERDLIEIAEDKIRKFYTTKIDPKLFSLIARYKPNKKNIPVLVFVARTVENQKRYSDNEHLRALYEPPEAGDKFEYIIVKKDQQYTLQGKKIELKKGDQMEFLRVYKASQDTPNPMEINLSYYMKNSIVGLFARFIAYHPKFQPPEGMFNCEDKQQYKAMDQFWINEATKYPIELCDSITGFSKQTLTQQGRDYRAVYRHADKKVRHDIATRYGGMGYIIHGIDIHDETDDVRAQSTRLIEQLKVLAKSMVYPNGYGKEYLSQNAKTNKISVFNLKRIYKSERDVSIAKVRINMCNKLESQITDKLYQVMPAASRVIYRYERNLINLIDDMRKIKSDDIIIDDDELEALNNLAPADYDAIKLTHSLLLDLVAIYKVTANTLDLVNEIELARANTVNEAVDPQINARLIAKTESRSAEIVPDYMWD